MAGIPIRARLVLWRAHRAKRRRLRWQTMSISEKMDAMDRLHAAYVLLQDLKRARPMKVRHNHDEPPRGDVAAP